MYNFTDGSFEALIISRPSSADLHTVLPEGTTASALLVAGGEKALSALQAMSIATGFIYTILICIACIALWRALKVG